MSYNYICYRLVKSSDTTRLENLWQERPESACYLAGISNGCLQTLEMIFTHSCFDEIKWHCILYWNGPQMSDIESIRINLPW